MGDKRTGLLAVLGLVAGVITASGGAAAASDGRSPHTGSSAGRAAAALQADLQQRAGATVVVRTTTGMATFAGGSPAHPLQEPSDDDSSAIARRFVDEYGRAFGVADPAAELAESSRVDEPTGDAVRFQQRYRGVPVIAGEIAVQISPQGAVLSSVGEVAVGLRLDVTSTVAAADAAETARLLTARNDRADLASLTASDPELWIFDPTLVDAPDAFGQVLVWRTEVRDAGGDVRRLVLVNARDGSIAFEISLIEEALNRSVCDNNNNPATSETCTTPVRTEGGLATGVVDVDDAYDNSGTTYVFYAGLGRDSIDGAGMPLLSTVRFCPGPGDCPYENAFWNGAQMVYGTGYASADDVVGHELTHGVTEFTSGLFYYSEAGAINESLSDVFGELIDLGSAASGPDAPGDRWLEGEDLPGGAIRNMSDPTTFGDPDRMTSANFFGGLGDNRGVHINSGVNNKAAFLITDGATFNGQTITGLGSAKTARVYYQAQTTMLGTGSDYFDLYSILPQACTNIIGVIGITANDCQQVTKAVTATEMNLAPVTAGSAAPVPAICDSGVQTSTAFLDDMNTASATWAATTAGGGGAWENVPGSSQSDRAYHVDDAFGPPAGLSTLTMQAPIAVPAGTNYLRFDHAFSTDFDDFGVYDGGVVEYSTNGGSSWTDIGALPAINGYNTALDTGFQNPLSGRNAFGTISPSFITTRVDVSSLAGQNVLLRFAFGSDNFPFFDFPGWTIDDVTVYGCGPGTPGAPTAVVGHGGNASVALAWTPPANAGVSPITGYSILPSIGGVAQTSIPVGNVTNFTVSGLTNGTTYTFAVAARNSFGLGPMSGSTGPVTPYAPFVSLLPARLLETRSGLSTIDGDFNAIGLRGAGSVTPVTVTGRGGVPGDAAAVVLNVTVTESQAPGYLTAYPCGVDPPTASNLNYVAGSTVPNMVVVKVGTNGQVCLFTQSATHVLVDVNGYFPNGSSLTSLVPARVLETRAGLSTIDGQLNGTGFRPAGSVTAIAVGGRAGVPVGAAAVVVNVTVTDALAPGYATIYPCGGDPPTASNINYLAGDTIPNAAVVKVGDGGAVCVFNQSGINLVVDVNGYFPAGADFVPLVPARILESRAGLSTIDGQMNAIGLIQGGSVIEIQVAGRAGVPGDATAVVLNVTVTETEAPGYATIYPCPGDPPTASNLNYGIGTTIANAAMARIGAGGKVCVFTQSATHLVVDVNGYFTG